MYFGHAPVCTAQAAPRLRAASAPGHALQPAEDHTCPFTCHACSSHPGVPSALHSTARSAHSSTFNSSTLLDSLAHKVPALTQGACTHWHTMCLHSLAHNVPALTGTQGACTHWHTRCLHSLAHKVPALAGTQGACTHWHTRCLHSLAHKVPALTGTQGACTHWHTRCLHSLAHKVPALTGTQGAHVPRAGQVRAGTWERSPLPGVLCMLPCIGHAVAGWDLNSLVKSQSFSLRFQSAPRFA